MNNDICRVVQYGDFYTKILFVDWSNRSLLNTCYLPHQVGRTEVSIFWAPWESTPRLARQTRASEMHLQTIHIKTSISLINSLNLILWLQHLFKLRYVMAVYGNRELTKGVGFVESRRARTTRPWFVTSFTILNASVRSQTWCCL